MRRIHTMQSSIYQIFLVLGTLCCAGFASSAHAATIFFDPLTAEFRSQDSVRVDVLIDTEGQNINAIGGVIRYPAEDMQLIDISDGGSILELWVEYPRETAKGQLTFSGIIPGGFEGVHQADSRILKAGKLMTLHFNTIRTGEIIIDASDIQLLLNDGLGTPVVATVLPFTATISTDALHFEESAADTSPPEPFTISVEQDDAAFEGKYFIVFDASDKDSGIDHYEVCELRTLLGRERCVNGWTRATSPFLLSDQRLESIITVKAIDRAGNERSSELLPQQKADNVLFRDLLFIGTLLLVLILILLVRRHFQSRS